MADGVEHVEPQLAALVVHGDAALAGEFEPTLAQQVDLVVAIVGDERLVDVLFQVGRVKVGRGLAAGQGLPCLDGAEVEDVARLRGRGRRVPGRVPLGRFDLGDAVQVVGQILRAVAGDVGDRLARPLRDGAGIIGLGIARSRALTSSWRSVSS
jgi:hypothetical protein